MDDLQIDPREVKRRLDAGEQLLLVDVREPWEFDLCRIVGAKLVPLGSVPSNLPVFDQDDEVVIYCHHGKRSLDAVVWLRQQGVEGARSMAGGIERWSREIDPAVPRY
jgi:rhodanese-related sulfurtransferase